MELFLAGLDVNGKTFGPIPELDKSILSSTDVAENHDRFDGFMGRTGGRIVHFSTIRIVIMEFKYEKWP
jgi:hypothetical protein